MSDKLCKILQIAKNVPDYREVIIWTYAFKARGQILSEHFADGIVTMTKVRVCKHLGECECEGDSKKEIYEWLNIFEDKIIGFSFIK